VGKPENERGRVGPSSEHIFGKAVLGKGKKNRDEGRGKLQTKAWGLRKGKREKEGRGGGGNAADRGGGFLRFFYPSLTRLSKTNKKTPPKKTPTPHQHPPKKTQEKSWSRKLCWWEKDHLAHEQTSFCEILKRVGGKK